MVKSSNNIRLQRVVIVCLCAMVMASCKQEVPAKNELRTTFVKVFGNDKQETAKNIQQCENGDLFITTASWTIDNFSVILADKMGNMKSITYYDVGDQFYPRCVKLKNGDFAVNSELSTAVFRFDKNGKKLWDWEFDKSLFNNFYYSKVIEGYDGHLYVSYTNGPGTGAPSLNYLEVLDENNGRSLGYYYFDDTEFGPGKVTQFQIFRIDSDTIYAIGSKFINNNWQFTDFPKFFTVKFYVGGGDVRIIDKLNDSEGDVINQYVPTSDGGVVCIIQNKTWLQTTTSDLRNTIEVFRFDKYAHMMWRKSVFLGSYSNAANGLSETPDGGFLLTGIAYTEGKKLSNPFVLKMNGSGEIVFQKMMSLGGNGMFFDGFQSAEGDLFLAGSTDIYGRGVQNADAVMVRTDRNGNMDGE